MMKTKKSFVRRGSLAVVAGLFGLSLGAGLFYMLPKTAYAEEIAANELVSGWEDIISHARTAPKENPYQVTLAQGAEVTLEHALTVQGNLELDLNGGTLNRGMNSADAFAEDGQVIRVAEGSSLTLTNGTLTGGYGNEGGALYAYSSNSSRSITITLRDMVITGNKANTGAGLFLHANTKLFAKNISVTKNTAMLNAGGIYLTGNGNNRAEAELSGKVVINGNNLAAEKTAKVGDDTVTLIQQSNLCFGGAYALSVGTLAQESRIGVSPNSTQTVIASDYKEYNKVDLKNIHVKGFALNPAKFFSLDYDKPKTENADYEAQLKHKAGYIVLDRDGNVVRTTAEVKLEVAYENDEIDPDTQELIKAPRTVIEDYGIEVAYGAEKPVRGIYINNNSVNTAAITDVNRDKNGNIIGHTRSLGVTNADGTVVYVAFEVFVTPTMFGDDTTITMDESQNLSYTGSAITPAVTVKHGTSTLVKDRDYKISYRDNIKIGIDTAKVIVTPIGNYGGGEKQLTFSITKSTTQYEQIVWEYLVDGEWTTSHDFVFDGADQSKTVRAKLVFGTQVEYVTVGASEGMYLEFDKPFKDAGTYRVTLKNTERGNATFPAENYTYTKDLTIAKLTVDIPLTGIESNLWLVNFRGTNSSLIDGADSDGTRNRYINGTTEMACDPNDSYADWRDGAMTLVLNENYSVNGVSLKAYLEAATSEPEYKHYKVTRETGKDPVEEEVASVTVAQNSKQEIKTTVEFGLDTKNFQDGNGDSVSLKLTKTWYIVTLVNTLTTLDEQNVPAPKDWTFGSAVGVQMLKPRSGDRVIYTFLKAGTKEGEEPTVINGVNYCEAGKFATVIKGTDVAYYNVGKDGSLVSLIKIEDYFDYFVERLGAGDYIMQVKVPKATNVAPVTRNFAFTVSAYPLEEGVKNGEIEIDFAESVVYNGQDNNLPEFTLTFRGRELEQDVDYELTSANKNFGSATLVITGIGGLSGELVLEDAYDITQAQNSWIRVPNMLGWEYMGFDKTVNRISAQPALLDEARYMWFKVSTDAEGKNLVEGLEAFTLRDGLVGDIHAEKLTALPAGYYYLFATVDGNYNYTTLAPEGIIFEVSTAKNYWEIAPSVTTWVTGSYDEAEHGVTARAHFGTTAIVITDEKGNVVYDSENAINLLDEAGVGTYVLTATVAESENYLGMSFTTTFRVFAKAGWPWWVTFIVVIAVLLVVAIVLIILGKKGILQMLSGKAVVAIRAKASADATIAAVKANKAAEEAKAALALAEARERIEALRLASEEAKNRSAVEQVEDLEERAQDAAKQAARMQKKAARIQKQADMMRAQATIGVEMEGQIPVMPTTGETAISEAKDKADGKQDE